VNTFTLIISDEETGKVKSIITDIRSVNLINSKEIGFTEFSGLRRTVAFYPNQKLEVIHREMRMP